MLLQQKKKANVVLGCMSQSTASSFKVVILLLSTDEAALGVLCPVLGFPVQERYGHTGGSPVKNIKEPEHVSYGERLRELGLFSLESTRLKGK